MRKPVSHNKQQKLGEEKRREEEANITLESFVVDHNGVENIELEEL